MQLTLLLAQHVFLDDDTMEVIFEEPQRAITPGQSVAFL